MALDIGKVGMMMKGDWNSSATYEVLDAVSYNNGLYIANQSVPANTLPTNTTYWDVAFQAPFTSGRFVTNAITTGTNSIDITSYTPYSGTMPTNGSKTIAVVNGFWDSADSDIKLTIAGNVITIIASKNNSHIGINWIQIP